MGIIITVLGCILGVVTFLVLALVTPIESWGEYSVGIIVALCLIWVEIVGVFPLWKR